jgi:hypothetical protein
VSAESAAAASAAAAARQHLTAALTTYHTHIHNIIYIHIYIYIILCPRFVYVLLKYVLWRRTYVLVDNDDNGLYNRVCREWIENQSKHQVSQTLFFQLLNNVVFKNVVIKLAVHHSALKESFEGLRNDISTGNYIEYLRDLVTIYPFIFIPHEALSALKTKLEKYEWNQAIHIAVETSLQSLPRAPIQALRLRDMRMLLAHMKSLCS